MIHAAIQTTSVGRGCVENALTGMIGSYPLESISLASAYLSNYGASFIETLARQQPARRIRVIAGLSQYITHPTALETLLRVPNVELRVNSPSFGIFHPKILVGFRSAFKVPSAICHYLGSANFTRGGLQSNVETAGFSADESESRSAAIALAKLWKLSKQLLPADFNEYKRKFSIAAANRSSRDVVAFGMADDTTAKHGLVISVANAQAVWAGLESFTGEHAFQVEFPKEAGEVLRNLLSPRHEERVRVKFQCADGGIREALYSFYKKNGMYRLNIPNDVPLVSWARSRHSGIARISVDGTGAHFLDILRGNAKLEVVAKTKALKNLRKTSTRQYGWY